MARPPAAVPGGPAVPDRRVSDKTDTEREYGRGVQLIDQVGTYVTSWRRCTRML